MPKTLLLILVMLTGLGMPVRGEAANAVRIGFSLAQTGVFAPAAPSQMNAYELWREEVNAKGGLDLAGERRPVEFVVYDDQSDPGQAVRIYEKLITKDKVDLLLAPWGTPHHFAVAGVLERYKFPMVGNSAASVQLRKIKPGYIWFPTPEIPDRVGVELAKMLKAAGVKSVAISTLQLPFPMEVKEFLVPALKKEAIEIVANQEYPPDIKDMTVLLSAVKDAAPDAVLSLSYPGDSVIHMNTARELNITAPFQFVLIGPTMNFFQDMFKEAADGIVAVGHWSPHQDKWPKAKPFFERYVKKFGSRPDYLDTVIAYMSCEILEQAVATAGLDKEEIRKNVAENTFDTINGKVKFSGVENSITPTAFLQFQGGEAQLVWPKEISTNTFTPKGPWPK